MRSLAQLPGASQSLLARAPSRTGRNAKGPFLGFARTPRPKTMATHLRISWAAWLMPLLLLTLPVGVQAQFTFTTNNGAITIKGYTGVGGAVTIPSATNGWPVTSIGFAAFYGCSNLTSVSIPNSVTNIESEAFFGCTSLTSVAIPTMVTIIKDDTFYQCANLTNATIPNGVRSIGNYAFEWCTSLISVTIPNSVTSIGVWAFRDCVWLTSVTIGTNVASIGDDAFDFCTNMTSITIPRSVTNFGSQFYGCSNLKGIYFEGNACSVVSFALARNSVVYYLPGSKGWGSTFGNRPTALWRPQVQTGDGSFGVRTNQFGFNVTWASGMTNVVEACTSLADPAWSALQTNILSSDSFYFSDPQWRNYPARFYRLRSP
jgi:hypothetical protein